MSRSYKKNPFTPITSSAANKGDKEFKQDSNRKYRTKVRDSLKKFFEDVEEEVDAPEWRIYHDPYNLRRDGNLQYRGHSLRKKIKK